MSNKEYKKQIADKRWKEKRNSILKRDGNKCQLCGSKYNLQVHHKFYDTTKFAWEYNNDDLITLCKLCHSKQHNDKIKRNKNGNFFVVYIDNLSGYMRLTANTDKSVLAYLCCFAEYDTGRVFLSPEERKEACNEIGICLQQFTNSLSKLKKLHLITGGNGFYMINPAIFWKGNSKTRESLLRDNKLAVEFNFEIYEDGE